MAVDFHKHGVPVIISSLAWLVCIRVNAVESGVMVTVTVRRDRKTLDFAQQNTIRLYASDNSVLIICKAFEPVEWVFDSDSMNNAPGQWTRRYGNYAYNALLDFDDYKSSAYYLFLCRSVRNNTDNALVQWKSDEGGRFVDITKFSASLRSDDPLFMNYSVGLRELANRTGESGNLGFEKIHFRIASTDKGYFFQCQLEGGTIGKILFEKCSGGYYYYWPSPLCSNILRRLKKVVHTVSKETVVEIPAEGEWTQLQDISPGVAVCIENVDALGQSAPSKLGAVEFFFSNENRGKQPKIEFSWHEIVPSDLLWIELEPIKNVYSLNETVEITCHIPKYGFSYKPVMEIFVNGTEVNQAADYYGSRLSWKEKLELAASTHGPGVYTVKCMAPVWNTTEWANASRVFKVGNGNLLSLPNLPSKWLEEVASTLDKVGIVSDTNTSKSAMQKISTNVAAGNYNGNDIKEIVNVVQKAVGLARTGVHADQDESVRNSVQIFNTILSNGQVWNSQELEPSNKSEVATAMLNRTEQILIEYSSRLLPSNTSNAYFEIKSNGPLHVVAGKQNVEDDVTNSSLTMYFPTDKAIGINVTTLMSTEPTQDPVNSSREPGPTVNSISLPAGWKHVVGSGRNSTISFAGTALRSDVAKTVFPMSAQGESSDSELVVNSAVLSFTVGHAPAKGLDDNGSLVILDKKVQFPGKGVEIEFENRVIAAEYCGNARNKRIRRDHRIVPMDLDSAVCVFWDTTNLRWSSEGCQLVSVTPLKTICECNHLTAFSVLMKPFPHESEPDSSLDLLTLVCCPIGIVCLLISVFILSIVKLKTATLQMTSRLTIHLSISLAIAKLMLLLLFDQTRIQMDNWPCYLIGLFTHYILLVAFCFMGLQGLHLYRLTVQVFPTNTSYAKWHFALAYLIPAIVVGVTALTGLANGRQAYGSETLCWLNGYYLIGGFVAPSAMLVGINLVLLSIALFQAANRKKQFARASKRNRYHKKEADKTALEKIKENLFWVKSVLALSSLLGATWIFGLLLLVCNETISQISAYLFTLLNASQGIFILFFHCIGNSNVRNEFARTIQSWAFVKALTELLGWSTNLSAVESQQSQEMNKLS